MQENNNCPCCGRHCSLDDPHCMRGINYKNKTESDEKEALSIDELLTMNLRELGHKLHLLSEGKGSQKRILRILYQNGAMTQKKLTEKIGIKPGSASEVIGKLENSNLISRTESSTDHRTQDIILTEEGKKIAKEEVLEKETKESAMFQALSEEEKETLLPILEKLNASWKEQFTSHEFSPEKHHHHHHGRK